MRSEVAALRAAADDAAQREAALEARLRAVASEHEYVALCMASHGVVVCVDGSPGGGWLRCSTRSGVLFHGCSTSTTCRLRRLPVVCSSVFAGRCHTRLCRTMYDAARHCKRRERSWSCQSAAWPSWTATWRTTRGEFAWRFHGAVESRRCRRLFACHRARVTCALSVVYDCECLDARVCVCMCMSVCVGVCARVCVVRQIMERDLAVEVVRGEVTAKSKEALQHKLNARYIRWCGAAPHGQGSAPP